MLLIKEASHDKLRGGFYTPQDIAEFILKWAFNGNTALDILEPSCGDGIFLKSIKKGKFKYNSITGVELDQVEAEKSKSIKLPNTTIINDDFHNYCINTKNKFDLIIGNPPYIRYQYFEKQQQNFASAFQDIVGQAQKNLGNLSPQEYQLLEKRDLWNSTYNNDNVNTNISRLRKGDNIDNAITQYQAAINNPHFKGEVHLVINFISKNTLEQNLNNLRDSVTFGRRSETIQILWFISLISSCQEVNKDVYIHCKP